MAKQTPSVLRREAERAMIAPSRVAPAPRQDEMHPPSAYADPSYATFPLEELRQEYLIQLRAQVPSVSPFTIKKYDDTLRRFFASLRTHGKELALASLTKVNAEQWAGDQKEAGLSEHTIVNRMAALKAFTGKYLFRDAAYTTIDLLGRVRKTMPQDAPRTPLTEIEREKIMDCFTDPTYVDTRDRAILAVAMATGLRFREVLEMPLASINRHTGDLVITGKGNKTRSARLSTRALKYVRTYLTDRPSSDSNRLWLTEYGQPLSYMGGHCIIRRVRQKSGVARVHWHLLRHGFAQFALVKGADAATVQEMLGHSSAAMTRKYLGLVKQQEAARLMPQFSPI